MAIPQFQPLLKKRLDLPGEPAGLAANRLQHMTTPLDIVHDALLMHGIPEPVVAGQAVVDHDPRIVGGQGLLGHLAAPAAGDSIIGRGFADQDVQPSGATADLPASLVADHPGLAGHGLADGSINRLASSCGVQDDLGRSAAGEFDSQETFHRMGNLAIAESALFVKIEQGRL
jgi:hypothetical protein